MSLLFGVAPLDEALEAEGGPILLRNEAGVEAVPFLVQAAACAIKHGHKVAYLTSDRPPARVRAMLAGAEDRAAVTILDAHSALSGIPDPDAVPIEDPTDWTEVQAVIEAHADKDTVLLIDSLSGLAMRAHAEPPEALLGALGKYRRAVVLYTDWGDQNDVGPFLAGFPSVVQLSGIQHRITTNQYFRLERVAGRSHESAPVLYRADEGMVRVYVPKIVITGPADAGKTTFVHAVSTRARSAERGGSTVAMDRGTIEREGLRVEIFGTPGQERFDPIITPILSQAVGLILVIDATDRDSVARAQDLLDRAWRSGLHAIVAANKQDLPNAMAHDDVLDLLVLPGDIESMPCQATDPGSATAVVDALIRKILATPEVTP